MFKYYEPLQNRSGDALPGYYVRLFDSNGTAVDIFADDNGTPISTASGKDNAAKSNDNGMVEFYIANGIYDIRLYNTNDEYVEVAPGIPMFDAGALTDDLASTTAGKGASLVALEGGGDVQTGVEARPTSAALAATGGAALVGLSAGGTVQDAIKWVTPEQFGAVGDGVNDDSAAFLAMAAAINALGSGSVLLSGTYRVQANVNQSVCRLESLSSLVISGDGKIVSDPIPAVWKTATSASGSPIVTISDATHSLTVGSEILVRGLSVSQANGYHVVTAVTPGVSFSYAPAVAPGSFTGTPEYTLADYFRSIFLLVDCSNVRIQADLRGDVLTVGYQHRLGYRGVYLAGSCSNINIDLYGSGLSYGIVQGDTMTGGSLRVRGENIGYGVSTTDASYFSIEVDVNITSRGVYYMNGGNSKIVSRSANYNSTAILVSRTTAGTTENLEIYAPAAPQTSALTLSRASSGEGVFVSHGGGTGGFRNLSIKAELMASDTEGLGRIPVYIDMTGLTGRLDDVRIESVLTRPAQTQVSQFENEFLLVAPGTCAVGNIDIVSIASDPTTLDFATNKGFIINIGTLDGVLSIDRRGGRSGYSLTLPTTADVRWINPPRPATAGGLGFPLTTNKQVVWTADNINADDFTVWMRPSSLTDKTGSRAMFFAGASTPGRSPNGMWLNLDTTSNAASFQILGATVNDYSGRAYDNIGKYCLPGFNDIFAIRRGGDLELWVNGIKLVGSAISGGTPPGITNSLTTSVVFFNGSTGNAFANELGGSGFYRKALTPDEMKLIGAGGTIADKSLILHQSDYRGVRRSRFTNPYSSHTATIGSDVSLISPSNVLEVSAVIDPPSISAGGIQTVTATVNGAVVGAAVTASPRNALAAGVIQMNPGRVSATNTVSIDLYNATGSPIDPASNTWDISVSR